MGIVLRATWIVIIAIVAGQSAPAPTPTPKPTPTQTPQTTSPGPLAAGHSNVDNSCGTCHVDNTTRIDANKCLACHRELAAQITAGKGLHASTVVRGKPCESCHLDHRGRGFDLTGWRSLKGGRDGFDHDLTGWPLDGVHRLRTCASCHTKKDKAGLDVFVGLDKQCSSCHANPHVGNLFGTRDCAECHSPRSMKLSTAFFDHTEHTRFDLGGHKVLACSRCHTPALGTSVPAMACESCHADRQPHGNRFDAFGKPPPCGLCHAYPIASTAQTKWRPRGFDHTKNTRWPLTWQHAQLACRACHRGTGPTSFEKLGPGTDCMGCHEHANVHDKKYTNAQCLQCHVAPGSSTIHAPGSSTIRTP